MIYSFYKLFDTSSPTRRRNAVWNYTKTYFELDNQFSDYTNWFGVSQDNPRLCLQLHTPFRCIPVSVPMQYPLWTLITTYEWLSATR